MSDSGEPRPFIAPRVETEGEDAAPVRSPPPSPPPPETPSGRVEDKPRETLFKAAPQFPEAAFDELPREKPFILPRIETDHLPAERLAQDLPPIPLQFGRGLSTMSLMLAGAGVLGTGFAALLAGNFVAEQFARSSWLGGLTLAVSVAGFGLLGAGVWREARGLFSLQGVDRERAAILGDDLQAARKAARRWLRNARHGGELLPAIEAAEDPAVIAALLRSGPLAVLREETDALARSAAIQVFSAASAIPSPSLDGFFVAWRGLRLVRQVAALHGMRPGFLGTVALLRRVALSAAAVVTTDVALNAALHALGTHPLLRHVAGDVAGAGVAARRMLVLARATAAACDPARREK